MLQAKFGGDHLELALSPKLNFKSSLFNLSYNRHATLLAAFLGPLDIRQLTSKLIPDLVDIFSSFLTMLEQWHTNMAELTKYNEQVAAELSFL